MNEAVGQLREVVSGEGTGGQVNDISSQALSITLSQ